jgi:hypothetical protein
VISIVNFSPSYPKGDAPFAKRLPWSKEPLEAIARYFQIIVSHRFRVAFGNHPHQLLDISRNEVSAQAA